MPYPKEFVDAVNAEFPNWHMLDESLRLNSPIIGECLQQYLAQHMSPEDIEKTSGKPNEFADKLRRVTTLYTQWEKINEAGQVSWLATP